MILCLGGYQGGNFCFGGAKGGLSAEGAKLRLPKARSPSRLGGLGSVVSSPSGVWGEAPETDAILDISSENGVHFLILLISLMFYFCTSMPYTPLCICVLLWVTRDRKLKRFGMLYRVTQNKWDLLL